MGPGQHTLSRPHPRVRAGRAHRCARSASGVGSELSGALLSLPRVPPTGPRRRPSDTTIASAPWAVRASSPFGVPEGLEGGHLIVPVPGAEYGKGDIVPQVRGRFGVRETGLIVPIDYARPPVPLDTVMTYLTGADVLGFRIPVESVVDAFEHLSLGAMLGMCSTLLHAIDNRAASPTEVDATLQPLFTDHGWRRVRALTARGDRQLVAPHVVMVAITLAARFSPEVVPGDGEGAGPIVALLGAADHLERLGGLDPEGSDDFIVGAGAPGRIEREIVSIGDFHGRLEPANLIARLVRRWIELPAEHAERSDVIDVSAEFAKATGVSIQEFLTAGLLFYGHCVLRGPRLPRDLLVSAGLRPDADRAIRELVTTDVTGLREWARGASDRSVWDFSHLGRFPLIDDGETLLAVRPLMILNRFFGWLPFHDVDDTLSSTARGRFRTCFGRLAELYALETLRAQATRRDYRIY